MRFDILTIFSEMFDALHYGVVGRAIERKMIDIHCWDPRQYSTDPHHRIDDRPYGGGPGMVMQVQPLRQTIQEIKKNGNAGPVIYLSPQGQPITQTKIQQWSQLSQIILLCGRYEGIDQRVIDNEVDEECSVGDYVISGGEFPAMLVIDAVSRILPGVLGHPESAQQDSFTQDLLDCPHYTRPEQIDGQAVPAILLSGDHQAIADWRLQQSLGKTWQRRPDLIKRRVLNKKEQALLTAYIKELASD